MRTPMEALAEDGAAGPPIPCAFVMVLHGSKVLWGLRCGKHAAGIWGWPGGKADRPGTMAANACAELLEETGIWAWADDLERIDAADEWIDEVTGQSYPNTYFILRISDGQAAALRVREPHKHSEWRWFESSSMPSPCFPVEAALVYRMFGFGA